MTEAMCAAVNHGGVGAAIRPSLRTIIGATLPERPLARAFRPRPVGSTRWFLSVATPRSASHGCAILLEGSLPEGMELLGAGCGIRSHSRSAMSTLVTLSSPHRSGST